MPRQSEIKIGTAGWGIPSSVRTSFPVEGSTLARYAAIFSAVEINSSFYRSHRPSTYARWAATVPPDFRFTVKLPKTITHGNRLEDCDNLLRQFFDETAGLGESLGAFLMQLPPSLAFGECKVSEFLHDFRECQSKPVVCEPRHLSWFTPEADQLLQCHRIARVAADPPPVEAAAIPGGFGAPTYFRLHGSPAIYRSEYGQQRLRQIALAARKAEQGSHDCWVIFDNTASGAAAADALNLRSILER